jgi:S1-C subfamily serine protease
MGLGFVVPSNLVRKRLFEHALPYLGVSLRVIPHEVCELFNWPVEAALLVERVKEGSVAAEAGLRGGEVTCDIGGSPLQMGGDLIVKVGPYETNQLDKIGEYLHGLKEGDKLKYGLLRAGKPVEVEVVIPALIPIPSLKAEPVKASTR